MHSDLKPLGLGDYGDRTKITMSQTAFLPHLHAFRAFAILSIVGAHAWSFLIFWTGDLDSLSMKVLFYTTETLFHGSTLYFTFISGLLFNLLLSQKSWSQFFKGKALNVFLPYALLSLVMTVYLTTRFPPASPFSLLTTYLHNLAAGSAAIQYWYMPVLFFLFSITPLLKAIQLRLPGLFWVLILLPLCISRSPFPDFLKLQTFFYFAGAYAAGMQLGQYYQQTMSWVDRYKFILLASAAILTSMLFALYWYNDTESSLFSMRQSLVYLQKVVITVLVLRYFQLYETRLPNWLTLVGSAAFAIYFLHVEFIALMIELLSEFIQQNRTADVLAVLGLVNWSIALIGSVLLALIIKKLIGRHARKLIGF
ncbi:hypothetical protein PALB_21620 [Pseudoalteromonas luteoviolacea B = ATCC 29581]|nr:hypothetical protein PALB_21620 [Pseudoalteromonas luteoviolacea B = ATCC 29581]